MTVHESSEFEFRAGGGRDVVFMERLRGWAREVPMRVVVWAGHARSEQFRVLGLDGEM